MADRTRLSGVNVRLSDVREGWSSLLPSAFVVVALLALLIVPLSVQERLDYLRAEIDEIGEPARDLVAEIEYLLARQSSARRGYLITDDAEFLQRYEALAAEERAIYPQLRAYASALSPEIAEITDELREFAEAWRRLVLASEIEQVTDVDSELVLREQAAFTSIFDAAARADLAIRGATLARAQEIRAVERMTRVVYSLLVIIALAAALAVALLNLRIRRLAAEANYRRSEVERALQETARAVESRAYLIRGFTHDVKNPLGAADGFASLLELGVRGELTEDQADTVGRIRKSISGAIEIIDELLDLSRLESGGLKTERVETDLDALVGESVRQHAVAAESAGLDLSFEPLGGGPRAIVFTDPDRVAQIVGNLISNALKYTPSRGRVVVGIRKREDGDAPHPGRWLAVSVEDTGPGIAPGEIERIFAEFHRVPGTPGEGHGLGLAISRGLAKLLGGDVTVRSVVGEGSEFVLWLPVRDAPPPA